MSILAAIKWIAIVAVLAFVYYLGGVPGRARLESLEAKQAQAVAIAVLAQQKGTDSEIARLNKVIATYEQTLLTPFDPNVVHRVFIAAAGACPVLETPATTGGIRPPGIPGGTREIEQAVGEVFAAGAHDAAEVIALRDAWPHAY